MDNHSNLIVQNSLLRLKVLSRHQQSRRKRYEELSVFPNIQKLKKLFKRNEESPQNAPILLQNKSFYGRKKIVKPRRKYRTTQNSIVQSNNTFIVQTQTMQIHQNVRGQSLNNSRIYKQDKCNPYNLEISDSIIEPQPKLPYKIPRRQQKQIIRKPQILDEFEDYYKPKSEIPLRIQSQTEKPGQSISIDYQYYLKLIKHLNQSNGIRIINVQKVFKYYIGNGNNSSLVNRVFQTRWWWKRSKSMKNCNFIWSQHSLKSILNQLQPGQVHRQASKVKLLDTQGTGIGKMTRLRIQNQKYGTDLIYESQYLTQPSNKRELDVSDVQIYNKLERGRELGFKTNLLKNLKDFCNDDIWKFVPKSFKIDYSMSQWDDFIRFNQNQKHPQIWIVKPGKRTNQGNGIKIYSCIDEIKEQISHQTNKSSYIIQKYLKKPLLISNRKFDIRVYSLVTCINGIIQGYYYKDGYIRTSSKDFTLKNLKNKFIHLTNDAVQKKSEDYGKYEPGNKMSFKEFQQYLSSKKQNINFETDIHHQIIEIVKISMQAACQKLSPRRLEHTFEIFGYDFMVDSNQKVWLIEVNSNPCLELSSAYLSHLIPNMLENSFKIALDQIFQPPEDNKKFLKWMNDFKFRNRFELIFSELINTID